MIYFTLLMLVLAITAICRGPVLKHLSVPWFFIGWLPGELPWLFAAMQIFGTVIFFLLADSIGIKEFVAVSIAAVTLLVWFNLHAKTWRAGAVFNTALRDMPGEKPELRSEKKPGIASPPVIHKRNWLRPFHYKREGVERIKNISYGNFARNKLDIYRKAGADPTTARSPVLLHVHGGAWAIGHKHQQALPLINYLAQNGWICVDINYRLAPKHPYPACLIDVKKAIVWIKENIAYYGGNPDFIAITGESAGGHLCALAALTCNNPQFQPGFETSDTQVQAAIPVYGVYDFTNHQRDGSLMQKFLEKYVMPQPFANDIEGWKNASPVFQINNPNLPIFVIHGDKDCVVPVEQARDFVRQLKQRNKAITLYAEIPGAQHGFDIFHSVRTEFHVEAIGTFLHHCFSTDPLNKN
jgi:acetyl esterase/lipase